ncbi:MAG: hypothetical protein JWL81_761 [Verrucomicrobiales bacterium]|nr:hypothetical protein [Verrucomicrobiales bacterium]
MSAEPATPSAESTPNFVVLPPAPAGTAVNDTSGTATAGTRSLPPALEALARNPLVLAGGAVLAGVVLSRFMATPSAKKIARELAAEALKHLKPVASSAAGMAGTAAAGSLLEKGMEKYGPQIADYGKKILADLLKKKE